METIYHKLIDLGYTDHQIRDAANAYPSSREFALAIMDTPDGVPIVGISYSCDFRAEEEWGVSGLRKAFFGNKHQEKHTANFVGLHSLVLSVQEIEPFTVWGHDLEELGKAGEQWSRLARGDDYRQHYSNSLPYAQKMPSATNRLSWMKMAELRDIAKAWGIKPMPRKKADLITAIEASPGYLSTAETPDIWPGWFHYGDVLILRADSGIVADTLDLLYEAAQASTLAVGGSALGFGSGIGIYDERDVGKKLKKERKLEAKWRKRALKDLEPVKAELKSRGHDWYALGNPKPQSDGKARYWLNGTGRGPGYNKQPYGWYTLEELLEEKFVVDVNTKRK